MMTDAELATEEFLDSEAHAAAFEFFMLYNGRQNDDEGETFLTWLDSRMFRNEFAMWQKGIRR